MAYQTVPLRNVLNHRKGSITIDDSVDYKLCRVQLHRKGVLLRQIQKGAEIRTKKQQVCRAGDFIVAEMDAKVGGYGFIPYELDGAIVSSHYYLFEVNESKLLPEYLYVLTQTDYIQSQIKATGSTNYASIRPSEVLELKIPLHSLEQQRVIVNRYNTARKKADVVTTELQTQQNLLAKLRQSILQEAVQGKLTERWRAERNGLKQAGAGQVAGSNPVGGSANEYQTPVTPGGTGSSPVRTANQSDETGAELLARIRAEKAELIRQGKLRKEKPLPPITDAEKPFDLPEGWVWCRLGEVNKVSSGITLGKRYTGPLIKVPYLRVANVQRNFINLALVKELDLPEKEIEKYRLVENDILVNEGGDYDKVGRAAKWLGQIENCIHQNHLFKVQVIRNNPDWVTLCINADHSRNHFLGGYVKTTNLASISSVTLKELTIPLPPINEQQAIVTRVERLFVQLRELEDENRQQQEEVGRLMQAVLREAFAGKEVVEN